jgi:uncharacterized protein YceK
MRLSSRVSGYVGVVVLAALTTGCATYRTISTAEVGTAKVFSGTRLDAIAIRGEKPSTRKFKAAPPENPAIDLPFSLALDLLILPLTVPSALYELVFE